MTIPCAHHRLIYQGRPLVMGILNVTPDSFSDGGRYAKADAAIRRAIDMVREGADVLDIGGESTRPGARPVPMAEELKRVVPVIRRLARATKIPLSVDTSKAEVARQAVDAGASIINDVTALRGDPVMARVAAQSRAAVILMHMRGSPRTMQRQPRYRDVVAEILAFLTGAAQAAQDAGIERSRILIDPGIGFGKSLQHNLALLRALGAFVETGVPVVVGPSRKCFIGEALDARVDARLAGTLACVAFAQQAGVHMVRVHDVRPAVDVIRMWERIGEAHAPRRQH